MSATISPMFDAGCIQGERQLAQRLGFEDPAEIEAAVRALVAAAREEYAVLSSTANGPAHDRRRRLGAALARFKEVAHE